MEQPASNLFEGYKSVGHITGQLPFVVRHGKDPQDTRIITIVGKTFHTYTTNLSLVEVSIPHESDIAALASDERHIYSASGRNILQWARGSKHLIQRLDNGHQADIKLMVRSGSNKIVSVDDDNILFNWDVKEKVILNILSFDSNTFKITALCHPLHYGDKCLLGSRQGSLQLWNVASETCLYKFKGWDAPVTCIAQSPCEDVLAIGLADGHVYVHNIKYDEVIVKIYQEYGSVTSMSFRLDGLPYLVTASEVGHLMIWNLERKRLASQIRNAHYEEVIKCQFLRHESMLVTSGTDNSLKVWTLDMSDGGGNLMCQRAGHSKSPSCIKFYGDKGFNLLSAGQDSTIKMFHMFSERLNRNLGTARMNPRSKHKDKLALNKLPPITCFAAETAKEKQWDNIAAVHQGSSLITTWNYDKCKMGEHIIMQPTFDKHQVVAECVCITGCGHFVVIGFSNGLVFKYNMQSGIFRQYYDSPQLNENRSHDGRVTGISVDSLDMVLVSAGYDGRLKLWNFKTGALLFENDFERPILKIELHRENNLTAITLQDSTIEIMDLETRTVIRKLSLSAKVVDMTFSPDSCWLIVSYDDKSIRTWDLSLGKLIDAFRLSSVCTSLAISSTGEFLATAHNDSLGVNIWCNYTIYCPSQLKQIDINEIPPMLDMPFVRCDEEFADDDLGTNNDDIVVDETNLAHDEYVSPEQLDEELITLSGLPASRWKNLLYIDDIRKKQTIEEEERKESGRQIKVPFFIPVKDGLKPELDAEIVKQLNQTEHDSEKGESRHKSKIRNLALLSPLAQILVECSNDNQPDYSLFLAELKELGPSATDAEIRMLGEETCGTTEPMLCFLAAIEQNLKKNIDYELTMSWLALFLKSHSECLQKDAQSKLRCAELLERVQNGWDRINDQFNQIFCVLNYVRSSIL